MKTKHKALFATVALLVAVAGSSTQAYAQGTSIGVGTGDSSVIEKSSANCEVAVQAMLAKGVVNIPNGLCRQSIKLTYSDSKPVTIAELPSLRGKMSTSEFAALTSAVTLGTVKSRTYIQTVGSVMVESQNGTFYYDGTRVWVTESYRGFTGSHRCQVERAALALVALQNCYETGSTASKKLSQQWLFTVSAEVLGVNIPVSWSDTYSLNVNQYGLTW